MPTKTSFFGCKPALIKFINLSTFSKLVKVKRTILSWCNRYIWPETIFKIHCLPLTNSILNVYYYISCFLPGNETNDFRCHITNESSLYRKYNRVHRENGDVPKKWLNQHFRHNWRIFCPHPQQWKKFHFVFFFDRMSSLQLFLSNSMFCITKNVSV